MLKEFKEFALKGNAIELAIGVIIGSSLQSIIKSLVNDIIMPLISLLFGKVDFSEWILKVGNTTIPYGSFISNIVNFILVAFALFLVVRYINRLNKELEEAKKENAKKFEKLRRKSKIFNKFSKPFVNNTKQEKTEILKPEATTKFCPYCLSEINIKAIRCPHCTSKLEEEK